MAIVIAAVAFKEIVIPKIESIDVPVKTDEIQKDTKHFTRYYYIHGLNHENSEGKRVIDVIMARAKNEVKYESYYKSITKQEMIDNCGDSVSEYAGVEIPAELERTKFEGKTAVRVYMLDDEGEREDVGWIPAEYANEVALDIHKHDHDEHIEIEGGKIKELVVDDNDKWKVNTYKEDLFPIVVIEYTKRDGAPRTEHA
ncbi:hypothetical protein IKE71_04125 [Candidatus Saccharibacteria bacterium]|nr:hypothetical protein [Candidatus Saccharibacteria bacterium]